MLFGAELGHEAAAAPGPILEGPLRSWGARWHPHALSLLEASTAPPWLSQRTQRQAPDPVLLRKPPIR